MEAESRLVGAQGLGERVGVTDNRHRVSLWGDEMLRNEAAQGRHNTKMY